MWLAPGVVDACLIPEVPFVLHGEKGLFKYIEGVLQARGHAVICIAEGAGQARPLRSLRCANALCCGAASCLCDAHARPWNRMPQARSRVFSHML